MQRLDRVGSTSDEARRLAAGGAPHGTAVVAREQVAGRGRHGRTWSSPPGNLYCSVVLRPGVPVPRLPELSFVAALAVADAADAALGRPAARLKWPNDVLLDGAKLAGLLLEVGPDDAAVLGMGVNVAHHPEGLDYPVTSLAAHGAAVDADGLASLLLPALERRLAEWQADGFAAMRAAWLRRGPVPGAPLRVRQGESWTAGRFAGLDADGALLLDTEAGPRRVVAGDVAA